MLLQKIIATVCTFFMMISGTFVGVNRLDTITRYTNAVNGVTLFENTMETALPQTDVYTQIQNHFSSDLPEGKTAKKAIVIGYDGCRADAWSLLADADHSAIRTLVDNGGHAVLTYCGGVNYPARNTQATSTAPGWCSMLTGQWADVHGVTNNGIEKSNDHLTLLTTLVRDGTIDDSAFYVSWNGHFGKKGTTYQREKLYTEENGIPVNFCMADDDDGTYGNVIRDLSAADCSDFIFSIFEYCDHAGHSTGFGPANPKYADAFTTVDALAVQILQAITSRDTYETEDWLILITTDHGGYNLSHGMRTIHERMTFLVSNKDILA